MMQTSEDVVTLDRGEGTTCSVHLFGGTVTSWKCRGTELIFVSAKSLFDNKKAIRGGIPIVFPNFGPWSLGPQHGFARIQRWSVSSPPTKDENGNITADFKLEDNDFTRNMWDHKFNLTYKIILGSNTLDTSLSVQNTGDKDFSFTWLLHTYLNVPEVTKISVTGLQGLRYADKVAAEESTETRDAVTIAENVDRVYMDTPVEHEVYQVNGGGSILLKKQQFPDTVVWNPWKEKAAAMSDFGDNEYPNMVCVEAGLVAKPQNLSPGGVFTSSQQLVYKSQL